MLDLAEAPYTPLPEIASIYDHRMLKEVLLSAPLSSKALYFRKPLYTVKFPFHGKFGLAAHSNHRIRVT